MKKRWMVWLCLCGLLFACGEEDLMLESQGQLALSLSSTAGGVAYQLSESHFRLEGPVQKELVSGNEPSLTMDLPPGAYRLTLLPGYQLVRADDPGVHPVQAALVSENPMTFSISAGETARVTLRFELVAAAAPNDAGTLAIDLEVASPDAAARCEDALRINEVDYEQPGTDEAEFIELLNAGTCPLALSGLTLELVNGGDGKVYSRYDLSAAGEQLAQGARLVIADSAVLSALPQGTLSMPLNGSGLQNGPDGLRVLRGDSVLDAMTYEGPVPGIEGEASMADDGEGTLSRCPDGLDTNAANLDFRLGEATPGAANACG